MAETILYKMATEMLNKLGSAALQEMGLAWGIAEELHKLRGTVSTIRAVILDAEQQQVTNHEIADWLEKLDDVVCDSDDLLDDFSTEVLPRKVMAHNKWAKKSNQCHRKKLDVIDEDRKKFHLVERSVWTQPVNHNSNKREETHSFVCAEEVIGREEDKAAVVRLLLDNGLSFQENVSILPIVGIGGLGKTSLAQLVYNDEKVTQQFTMKMWVCVSDVFNVKVIMGKIIESATCKKPENLQMDGMQDQLRKEIGGKKYLLVLDDVWNEDRDGWLKLRNLLMGGARGSKILRTTRTTLVATITGTMPPYLLEGLSENESWSLFKKMAFKQGEEPESPHLVAIGKEIAEKCGGVPLALRALGSLLFSKDTEEE
ncbi:putative disease resistance protein RGA1 [Cornus florida]|uniref:putative disease resistance protein RGA1 n=1 Tax=Cornus florida TaxID=4283 RepID=UPI00289FE28F|nr:putative disease resistance protein RGA1 [Cornus florida]